MSKKLIKEEFISKSRIIHNNKYDYSKVNYINNSTKVCIICPEHGEFWQTPKDHLKGRGCSKCGHNRTNKSKVLTTEQFIKRARLKHGNKYNYNKTVYKSFKDNVLITCPIHGDFYINAHSHLSNGAGCPECAKIAKGPKRLTTEEFIEKAKKIYGDLYDYSKVKYTLSSKPIIITCSKHGDFLITPNHHLNGEGCPKCAASKGERFINDCLTRLNIKFDSQYCLKFNNPLKNYFRIDFCINLDKIYLVEYNGVQHYFPSKYFGGETQFKKQQLRDQLLRDFVNKNSNRYELLEIDYRYNKYTIITKLLKFLKVPISSDINSKLGELLESCDANQQPSLELTIEEGSETNTWNCNTEYNSDTSTQHLEIDDDIVRAGVNKETSEIII